MKNKLLFGAARLLFKDPAKVSGGPKGSPELNASQVADYKKRLERILDSKVKVKDKPAQPSYLNQLKVLDAKKAQNIRGDIFNGEYNIGTKKYKGFEAYIKAQWKKIAGDPRLKDKPAEKVKALKAFIDTLGKKMNERIKAIVERTKKERTEAVNAYFGNKPKELGGKYKEKVTKDGGIIKAKVEELAKPKKWKKLKKEERDYYIALVDKIAKAKIEDLRKKIYKDPLAFKVSGKGKARNVEFNTKYKPYAKHMEALQKDANSAVVDHYSFRNNTNSNFDKKTGKATMYNSVEEVGCNVEQCKKIRQAMIDRIRAILAKSKDGKVYVSLKSFASIDANGKKAYREWYNKKLARDRGMKEKNILLGMLKPEERARVTFYWANKGEAVDPKNTDRPSWLPDTIPWKGKDIIEKLELVIGYLYYGSRRKYTWRKVISEYNAYRKLVLGLGLQKAITKKPEIFKGQNGQRLLAFIDKYFGHNRRVEVTISDKNPVETMRAESLDKLRKAVPKGYKIMAKGNNVFLITSPSGDRTAELKVAFKKNEGEVSLIQFAPPKMKPKGIKGVGKNFRSLKDAIAWISKPDNYYKLTKDQQKQLKGEIDKAKEAQTQLAFTLKYVGMLDKKYDVTKGPNGYIVKTKDGMKSSRVIINPKDKVVIVMGHGGKVTHYSDANKAGFKLADIQKDINKDNFLWDASPKEQAAAKAANKAKAEALKKENEALKKKADAWIAALKKDARLSKLLKKDLKIEWNKKNELVITYKGKRAMKRLNRDELKAFLNKPIDKQSVERVIKLLIKNVEKIKAKEKAKAALKIKADAYMANLIIGSKYKSTFTGFEDHKEDWAHIYISDAKMTKPFLAAVYTIKEGTKIVGSISYTDQNKVVVWSYDGKEYPYYNNYSTSAAASKVLKFK